MARLTVKELRKAMDIELEAVWYRLVSKIGTLADRQADMAMRYDRQTDQVITLTQLAAQQAEVIAELTSKLEELAESHNRLQQRENQTFTLTASNANRLELHGAWISDLFNRINESEVKE